MAQFLITAGSYTWAGGTEDSDLLDSTVGMHLRDDRGLGIL